MVRLGRALKAIFWFIVAIILCGLCSTKYLSDYAPTLGNLSGQELTDTSLFVIFNIIIIGIVVLIIIGLIKLFK